MLPNNAFACYNIFSFLERAFPSNIVIRHRDCRNTGTCMNGELLTAADPQCTYYHFNKSHIPKKNTNLMFLFNPIVNI